MPLPGEPAAPEPPAAGRFADVRRVAETGSTNADLLALARDGAPEGIVLVTAHQTAGRGRRGRTWTAAPGSGLLASALCRPPLPPARAHLVTVAVALAAADAVEAVAGARPALKWPNDLVVEEADGTARKLAGVLAESVVTGSSLSAVVVGCGLNVRWDDPPPDEIAAGATTASRLAGRPVDVDEVLAAWLPALDRRYGTLVGPDGVAATAAAHRTACATLGRRVRVELGDGAAVTGEAVDVDDDGHLVLDVDGVERRLAVGDVVHLRADEGAG